MISYRKLMFALLALSLSLNGQQLTLEDIFLNNKYSTEAIESLGWIEGGRAYLTLTEGISGLEITRNDVQTGVESTLLSAAEITSGGGPDSPSFNSIALSSDGSWALIGGSTLKVWRRSSKTNYYLYHFATDTVRPLTTWDEHQQAATFSPDGQFVAYVLENNLYVLDLTRDKIRPLTRDGNFRIVNGHADWLYEEEFSLTQAYEWSPDSKSIAFLRFHQWPGLKAPKTYPLVDEMTTYPTVFNLPYPKVGEKNSVMKLGVVGVAKGKPKWIDLGGETDIYVPRIYWTGRKNEIAFLRFDRRQQRLELLTASAKSGKSQVAISQSDAAWVDLTDDLRFLGGGRQLIWTDEKSGYRHIYLHDLATGQPTAITNGDWEVTSIVGLDETSGQVYFYSKMNGSTQQQLYRVDLAGNDPVRLTGPGGWHSVDMAPDFAHFIHTASGINTPPSQSLKNIDGQLVRWLVQSSLPEWHEAAAPDWELFDLTTTDGTQLRAKILRPTDFTANQTYPTLIYTYGGPGSQKVIDRWGESRYRDLWHRYMATQGYIILTVDNRGTGGRGKAFKNLAYGDLGKWSLHDQSEAAKWVSGQSWGDAARIGIWGWSSGGYLTALALTAGSETFKMGIAVSPVSDFRLYDTAWTERYMGLLGENFAGYESADVLSHLDSYRGNLLIVHGTGDDNVHPQNSWQLIDGLVKRNAHFTMQMYPNKSHGLPGVHYHLYSLMTRYVAANL